MTQLSEKKCIPCEGNTSAFDYSEIHKYLKKINDWEVKTNEQKKYYLEKNFKTKNFLSSQKFVNLVGGIAEKESHHPDVHVASFCLFKCLRKQNVINIC